MLTVLMSHKEIPVRFAKVTRLSSTYRYTYLITIILITKTHNNCTKLVLVH